MQIQEVWVFDTKSRMSLCVALFPGAERENAILENPSACKASTEYSLYFLHIHS